MRIDSRIPSGPKGGPSASGRDHRPFARKVLDCGLLALLVWSPLPAASVKEWSILIIEIAVALLGAAYVFCDPKPTLNIHMPPALRRLRLPVAGLFGVLAFQILPLPVGLVRILSPGTYAFHKQFSPDFARMTLMTLSVVPSATFRAGLELLTYFLLGFLVIKTVNHGRQIRSIIIGLVGIGVFEALYGLFELTKGAPRILFYKKVFNLNSVTGTFVNQSHFSGYLEMIVPLAIGLIIARTSFLSIGIKGIKEKILLITSQGILANILIALGTVIMSLGIIASNSRAGLVVLIFSFFMVFGLFALSFSRTGFRQLWIKNFIRIMFLAILALALYIGIGSSIQRFGLDNLLHEDRPLYWANVVKMIGDFPLFGTGLGTFVSAYPFYEKRGAADMLLVHAHNDYLEYLAELGVVGTVFLLGCILTLVVQAVRAWRERRNPEAKGMALGGIVSLAGIGLHTVTDFNLHIPANAALFTVVLSLTFVAAFYRKT
jgi:O-antigen ligase